VLVCGKAFNQAEPPKGASAYLPMQAVTGRDVHGSGRHRVSDR